MRFIVTVTHRSAIQKIEQAIARGLNEGGDLVRTQVRRELKAVTNVKAYRSVTSRTAEAGKGGNRAAPGRLRYVITATGKGVPIKEVPVRVIKGPGGGVDAQSWGVDHKFKRSFVENGKFKARIGPKRFPIRSLYGPSMPKELVKGKVAATFYRVSGDVVPPAVLKHLAKALG